jgi:hypothetical protein
MIRTALVLAVFALNSAQAQRPEADVIAGISLRVVVPAKPDTILFKRTITRDGVDSASGYRSVVVQGTKARDGSALLQVVQRFPAGMGFIVDTAIADARSFNAVAHRSHQPSRTMRFTFAGGIAEGEITEEAGPAGPNGSSGGAAVKAADATPQEPIKQVLGGPIFDSNVIEMVVAAMPLSPGFTTNAPFFIYEQGGKVAMPVAVKERATKAFEAFGQRDVWIVAVGVPGAPATVWVDAATRAVLRVQYDIASRRMRMTDDRETRLP